MSGGSAGSSSAPRFNDDGLSWCACNLGVAVILLRGDTDLFFFGEQDRLFRGDERSDGVPPRFNARTMGLGSVLGIRAMMGFC